MIGIVMSIACLHASEMALNNRTPTYTYAHKIKPGYICYVSYFRYSHINKFRALFCAINKIEMNT